MANAAATVTAARIVDDEQPQPMRESGAKKPGLRGSKQCWCQGEFLMMVGQYGWILSLDCIDHPDAGKHDGDIYVSKKDIGGQTFKKGDIVGFYLYADSHGLGAEGCTLIQEAIGVEYDDACWSNDWKQGVGAEALVGVQGWAVNEAVDWNDWAHTPKYHETWQLNEYGVHTVSGDGDVTNHAPFASFSTMNPNLPEFVPIGVGMNPHASEFVPDQYVKEDGCVSTSEGEEDGFTSSDGSSDAETDHRQTSFQPPPGLTLLPWRRGHLTAKPTAGDSSSDDNSDVSSQQTTKPWRRCAKNTAIESLAPLRAPPGLTLPPWRRGNWQGGLGSVERLAGDSSSEDDADVPRSAYLPPWRRADAVLPA